MQLKNSADHITVSTEKGSDLSSVIAAFVFGIIGRRWPTGASVFSEHLFMTDIPGQHHTALNHRRTGYGCGVRLRATSLPRRHCLTG